MAIDECRITAEEYFKYVGNANPTDEETAQIEVCIDIGWDVIASYEKCIKAKKVGCSSIKMASYFATKWACSLLNDGDCDQSIDARFNSYKEGSFSYTLSDDASGLLSDSNMFKANQFLQGCLSGEYIDVAFAGGVDDECKPKPRGCCSC